MKYPEKQKCTLIRISGALHMLAKAPEIPTQMALINIWRHKAKAQLILIKPGIESQAQTQAKNLVRERQVRRRGNRCERLEDDSCSVIPHALGDDMTVCKWSDYS